MEETDEASHEVGASGVTHLDGQGYGCPRCAAHFDDWRGIKLHMHRSARCRATLEDLSVVQSRRLCRQAAGLAALFPRMVPHDPHRKSCNKVPESRCDAPPTPEVRPELDVNFHQTGDAADPPLAAFAGVASPASGAVVGVGAEILAADGTSLGVVVAEERRGWRLEGGRLMRKIGEHRKWRWATSFPPGKQQQQLVASPGAIRAAKGIGEEIVGLDGRSWGRAEAEERTCWRLQGGRIVKKSAEGRKWRWLSYADVVDSSPSGTDGDVLAEDASLCARDVGVAIDEDFPETVGNLDFLIGASDWLPLRAVLNACAVSKDWSAALEGHAPLLLPPPQASKYLEFCLLHVLVKFNDNRLPLPMSAVYSEMRAVGRRAAANPTIRAHLEKVICCPHGPACKTQQEQFLLKQRPHHVAWSAEVKSSTFKNLERFAKHYDGERLIEVFNQRWHKRIHHSPNTRTCTEWLLVNVHRKHPLFVEHRAWLQMAILEHSAWLRTAIVG
mmetsp:Transcript_108216/g.304939  ORF Transcript_108216/g.304939 Transcript_108216/m.304939 type:complete len:500 (-) Transcript_108216:45-1544(-)